MKIKIYILILLAIIAISYGGYYAYDNIQIVTTQLTSLYAWLNKQNPMIAGAIMLWGLGVLTFIARSTPTKILAWSEKQLTITLSINNIDDVYDNFLQWYHDTGRSNKSRTLILKNADYRYIDPEDIRRTNISAGYGNHYFIFNKRLFKFSRDLKEATNTKEVKETITLTTIGRSQDSFHRLIKEITPKKNKEKTDIHKWHGGDGYWKSYGIQDIRPFNSVIIPQQQKDEITDHIDTFLGQREWYIGNGIPYRTGLIFHGVPGTGKTSLVRGLCEKYNKPLYMLSLSGMTDNSFDDALSSLPKNSILLIEDVDTHNVTNSKKAIKDDGELSIDLNLLSLSGLLNGIDGVLGSNGRILIITTNHIEKLDDAFTRKGRFNLSVNIGHITDECFAIFFKRFFPQFTLPNVIDFKEDVTPAHLQSVIMDNLDSPQTVLDFCQKSQINIKTIIRNNNDEFCEEA